MKITRAQKDAVIESLREKLNEKENIEKEKWLKKNAKAIAKEVEEINDLFERYKTLCKEVVQIQQKCQNLNFHNDPHFEFKTDRYDSVQRKWISEFYPFMQDLSYNFKINRPDFCKVDRELELATLAKDFDVEKFLKKYLEN